jgi:glucose-1-phosphate adenylyltransferase
MPTTAKSSHDFGKDIIPLDHRHPTGDGLPVPRREARRQAYWRDVGTVDSYWQANMELIGVTPELNLYDSDWPIWTYQEQWPPAKFVFDDDDGRRGMAVDSMVSGAASSRAALVRHSLLFSDVQVDTGSVVHDSVILPSVHVGQDCEVSAA